MVAANDRTQDNFDWGCYTITKLFYYEIDFLMFLEQKMLQIFVIDFFPFNFDKNQLWSTFSLFLQSFEIGT